jgi:hypothetical protein
MYYSCLLNIKYSMICIVVVSVRINHLVETVRMVVLSFIFIVKMVCIVYFT